MHATAHGRIGFPTGPSRARAARVGRIGGNYTRLCGTCTEHLRLVERQNCPESRASARKRRRFGCGVGVDCCCSDSIRSGSTVRAFTVQWPTSVQPVAHPRRPDAAGMNRQFGSHLGRVGAMPHFELSKIRKVREGGQCGMGIEEMSCSPSENPGSSNSSHDVICDALGFDGRDDRQDATDSASVVHFIGDATAELQCRRGAECSNSSGDDSAAPGPADPSALPGPYPRSRPESQPPSAPEFEVRNHPVETHTTLPGWKCSARDSQWHTPVFGTSMNDNGAGAYSGRLQRKRATDHESGVPAVSPSAAAASHSAAENVAELEPLPLPKPPVPRQILNRTCYRPPKVARVLSSSVMLAIGQVLELFDSCNSCCTLPFFVSAGSSNAIPRSGTSYP